MPGLRAVLIFTLLCSFAGCRAATEERPRVSLYYWRTDFALTDAETAQLASLGAKRLYVRFFDVDRPGRASAPARVAPVRFEQPPPRGIEIVPCVFLTNRTVKNTPADEMPALASFIASSLAELAAGVPFREIQLDCDWTPATRERFFSLFPLLRRADLRVSSTLRLHQLKFPEETGIPPADAVSLMLYNMGDVDDPGSFNSILNLPAAAAYLKGAKPYPLPLGVVFPVFGWGVVYRRGQVARLVNGLSAEELNDPGTYAPVPGGKFQVLRGHYLRGIYLYRDDLIRVESVGEKDLRELAALVRPLFRETGHEIAFFSLTPENVQRFPHEKLRPVLDTLL